MDRVLPTEGRSLSSWLECELRGWQEIERLVAEITPEQASIAGYYPGWSVKDMLAHLAGWFAEAGMELERVEPGPDASLSVDEKNEIFVEANRDQPLSIVLGEARTARNRMIQDLRTFGRIPEHAEATVRKAGPEHYLEHLGRLQQWVAELQANAGYRSAGPVRRHDFLARGTAPDPTYAWRLR